MGLNYQWHGSGSATQFSCVSVWDKACYNLRNLLQNFQDSRWQNAMFRGEYPMGRLKLIILLCIGVVLAFPALGDDSDKSEKHWRYRIFTAEHESIQRGGGSKLVKSIFKIDLETGKVWRYRQGIDSEGKKYEEFFEIPEQ